MRALDAFSERAGHERAVLNVLLTSGYVMIALRRGLPMVWIKRNGVRDCVVCRKPPEIPGREARRVDHESLRYVLLASDGSGATGDWYDVPAERNGALLGIDRSLDVLVETL